MLYLHIGSNKAGSTSIQSFLRRYSLPETHAHVKSFGWPNAWKLSAFSGTETAYRYWVDNHKIITQDEFENIKTGLVDETASEIDALGAVSHVASSEYVFAHLGDDEGAIGSLIQSLRDLFSEVVVIVYLRDQLGWLRSVYAQSVKGPSRSTDEFRSFIEYSCERKLLWDYARKIKVWEAVVGKSNLRIVPFHIENFVGGSLLKDFCYRSAIELGAGADPVESRDENYSPTYFQLCLLRLRNRVPGNWFPSYACVNPVTARIDWPFPTEHEQKILDLVSEGNEWLNRSYFESFPRKLPTGGAA